MVVILPYGFCYNIYKFICRYTFFYNKYSDGSYQYARELTDITEDEKLWNRNVRLLYLIDISDFWLAYLRPAKMRRLLVRDGKWGKNREFMLLGLHYGPGYITLVDLESSGYFPHFVYAEPQVDFKFQSIIERKYRNSRIKHVNKISGSSAVSTGGGYQKIKNTISQGGTPIILYDAPRTKENSKYYLHIFGKKYGVAGGFVNLVCKECIDFQLYFVKLNFKTGIREVTIGKIESAGSEQQLLKKLSDFFETAVKNSPEQWFFWRQSPDLLEEI